MLRKVLVALVCLTMASALWSWAATTWQIQTKLNTAGGTLQVRNNAPQTSVGNLVFTNFTTSADVPVKVSANAGYKISALTRNGAAVALGNYTAHYQTTFNKSAGLTQSLNASFAAKSLTVTGVASGPGSVTPASTTVATGGSATLTATPTYSYGIITGVSVNGSSYPGTYPRTGSMLISLTNVTATTTVTAYFSNVTANAGPDQLVLTGTPVTLQGSATGGGTTSWSETSGPTFIDTSSWTTLTPTFTPRVAGTYIFKLSQLVNGSAVASSSTKVIVTNSDIDYQRSSCNGCHSPNGVSPSTSFQLWSTSTHKANQVSCTTCHTTAAMPTPVNTSSVDVNTLKVLSPSAGTVGTYYCLGCHDPAIGNEYDGSPHKANGVSCTGCHNNAPHNPDLTLAVCNNCHRDASGNIPGHPVAIGSNPCTSCHNVHSTKGMTAQHFNNRTSAGYPASYATSRSLCEDCHNTSDAGNATKRHEWSTSGHGSVNAPAWMGQDYKTISGCVQCHTTTGFIAYSTGRMTDAWGVASDKTKEILACNACHSDIASGTLRPAATVRPYADDPDFAMADAGKSNLCVVCHSGTRSGKSISAQLEGFGDFTNMAFVDPHGMAAAGLTSGRIGYSFPNRSYSSVAGHGSIGLTDGRGECVACHKNEANGHAMKAGSVALCTNCHGSAMDAAKIASAKSSFQNALEVLKAQLAANGFVYVGAPRYFVNTNWGSGQSGANTMGAAFNYVLFATEPGAYVHNPSYAQQLVIDSIDFLDNGQFDDSVTNLAVPTLLASQAISQQVADSVPAYKNKDNCILCHGSGFASASPITTNGHATHLSGSYGPGSYLGRDTGACVSCHLYGTTTHANGVVNLASGAGSACDSCHAGSIPTWNNRARLECTTCHAANPARLSNGVAAPYKALFGSKGHGAASAGMVSCNDCHDPDSSHITGTLGSTMRLRLPNDNNLCASCHYYLLGADNRTAMNTHQELPCLTCHDPHGTGNLYMVRSTLAGQTVSFTNDVTGLIDSVTNRGVCQVCHTTTKYYKAGVAETEHYTSGCLNCHTHNAKGGAFKPMGTCNACHGYPPAPKRTSYFVSFGTMNNWSSARFEDYTGGGGAHLVAAHVPKNARPSEGWANCTGCHNAGNTESAPYHLMALPVSSHAGSVTIAMDPKLRFDDSFIVYTGARMADQPAQNSTGSCFNISCHMSRSPRWSIER